MHHHAGDIFTLPDNDQPAGDVLPAVRHKPSGDGWSRMFKAGRKQAGSIEAAEEARMTGPINSDRYSELVRAEEKLQEIAANFLCPIHKSLDDRDELKPFDNCIACIRNERDELRLDHEQARAALKLATDALEMASEFIFTNGDGCHECAACGHQTRLLESDIQHDPDCPVVAMRAALSNEAVAAELARQATLRADHELLDEAQRYCATDDSDFRATLSAMVEFRKRRKFEIYALWQSGTAEATK